VEFHARFVQHAFLDDGVAAVHALRLATDHCHPQMGGAATTRRAITIPDDPAKFYALDGATTGV
jgi:hypothetical protein